jgi:hypothetical protein
MTPQYLNLGHVPLKHKFYSFATNSAPPQLKMQQNVNRAVVGHLKKMEKGGQDSWLQGIYTREEWRK